MRVRPRSLPTICTGDSGEAAGLLEGRASCKAPPAVSAPGVTITRADTSGKAGSEVVTGSIGCRVRLGSPSL